jgi:hypothetical protein
VIERRRTDATTLLSRALRKTAEAEDPDKLRAAAGQAFFLGKCFAQECAPAEVEMLRCLGRACHQVGLWSRQHIAEQLKEAFAAGEARGLREDLQP